MGGSFYEPEDEEDRVIEEVWRWAVEEIEETKEQIVSQFRDSRERCILRYVFGLRDGRPHNIRDTCFWMEVSEEEVRNLKYQALHEVAPDLAEADRRGARVLSKFLRQ